MRDRFLLRPDVIFLNHGSFGACPRPVFEAYRRWQEELERQPVEFLGRRFRALLRDAREALADAVGAEPDELVYVPNATTAVNIAARSLPLGPGDEVLSTDHEYGAMRRLWSMVCAARGARYVEAPVDVPVRSAEEIAGRIWAHVTPRTRVLFASHITSPTALILPLDPLIRRAREQGITTVIDGAHAVGQIPVDLARLGADVYAANCHKWLCAPKGSGFLYVRRDRQPFIRPLIVSWGAEAEDAGASTFLNELEWQGTRDIAAYLAVPEAITFQRRNGWDGVRAAAHALAADARRRIAAVTGQPPLSPDGAAWYAQMVSLPLPVRDPCVAQRHLLQAHGIEVPVIPWQERALLRVSVQAYNTAADVEALVDALPEVLES